MPGFSGGPFIVVVAAAAGGIALGWHLARILLIYRGVATRRSRDASALGLVPHPYSDHRSRPWHSPASGASGRSRSTFPASGCAGRRGSRAWRGRAGGNAPRPLRDDRPERHDRGRDRLRGGPHARGRTHHALRRRDRRGDDVPAGRVDPRTRLSTRPRRRYADSSSTRGRPGTKPSARQPIGPRSSSWSTTSSSRIAPGSPAMSAGLDCTGRPTTAMTCCGA